MISEFKYGQAQKTWPPSLSLPLYSTFKHQSYADQHMFHVVNVLNLGHIWQKLS